MLRKSFKCSEEVHYDFDPDITETVPKTVLTVGKKLLMFIREQENYNWDINTVKDHHTNICELGVRFWCNGLHPRGKQAKVDYTGDVYVPFTLSWLQDMIANIPHGSREERVYENEKGTRRSSELFFWNINCFLALKIGCKVYFFGET